MAQMKEQVKTPEKELSNEEIAHLSDAEFKTLVIRVLTEMTQCSHKIKEEVKAIQSEIKKNIKGTNSEGEETRTQINDFDQKEEINLQPDRMKKQEFIKMRKGLGTSGSTLNIPKSKSLGCQKEKGKSEKLKTYLKK